ncbi:MAG: MmgE/PrpD family protein [Desulfobacteraceae bacterium]|jgi:2-methylcitrate dehydratase PrpD
MDTRDIILEFIAHSTLDDFHSDVVSFAKRSLLDAIGNMIAGVCTKASTAARNFACGFISPQEATLFGKTQKVPCAFAAFANSIMASDLDADDGHRGAMGHPGAAVVTASLAVGEKDKLNGKSLLEAIVVGYEIAIRMGIIANKHHKTRYMGSGNWVSFGVAAAAVKLMKMGKEKCLNALGICDAHTPKAPMEWMFSGSYPMIKEAIGWGAFSGVTSAMLANSGMRGTFSVHNDEKYNLNTLGKEFEFEKVYFKQHSCCRYTHPAINGVLWLKNNKKFKNEEIAKINIGTFDFALNLKSRKPKSIQEAEYSVPFTVGAALAYGQVGPTEICEQKLQDNKILTLANKVELHLDADIQKQFPTHTLARVEVELTDGSSITMDPFPLKGDHRNPLTQEELEDKFRRFSASRLKDVQLNEIISLCHKVDQLDDISSLTEHVGSAINESLHIS